MSQTRYTDEPSTSASMIARAQQGDATSWKELAQVYGPVVYGWARRCGCQSADAADVMQDTFAAVAGHLSNFDLERSGATFRGWLWTISRNKIRDLARVAAEECAVGGTDADLAMRQLQDATDADEPPTDADNDAAGVRGRLIETLRQKFDQRTWRMFWESAIAGRPSSDVAEEMGVTKWAVYKARARVLQRLKQEMNDLQ